MRQVTHALLTRPPLSHFFIPRKSKCFVRLACVRHAASVHPEPGSNSHVKVYPSSKLSLASFKPFYCCFRFCSECSHSWPKPLSHFYKNFQGFTYCSVFKVLVVVLSGNSGILSQLFLFVNNFFQLFSKFFFKIFNQSLAEKEGFEPSRRFPDLHP